ncbi:hypothetical protein K402DRAFT_453877 [Aulographum hederae CBS 113979]|uniref:Uncharacterized protein n=1 Tax=Aulographum hederae CBS 113979 TaxID=1176131 RepID=A0A6G1H1W9_9PEZI|nr:hypothetical protein K402DRAFT_453877 [Aulographum hederae CBS 113979]
MDSKYTPANRSSLDEIDTSNVDSPLNSPLETEMEMEKPLRASSSSPSPSSSFSHHRDHNRNRSFGSRRKRPLGTYLLAFSLVLNTLLLSGILVVVGKIYWRGGGGSGNGGCDVKAVEEAVGQAVGVKEGEAMEGKEMGEMSTEGVVVGRPGLEELPLMADVQGIVPEFETEKVIFDADFRYANADMFTNKTEYLRILKQWKSAMPLGKGFIQIPSASTLHPTLPPPLRIHSHPSRSGYSIASLHQFHCLYMILSAHGKLSFNVPEKNEDMKRHVTHCFDYLRQSVLCAGDSALEGVSKTVRGMADGWGVMHVCKREGRREGEGGWRGWVLENRLSNFTGISWGGGGEGEGGWRGWVLENRLSNFTGIS